MSSVSAPNYLAKNAVSIGRYDANGPGARLTGNAPRRFQSSLFADPLVPQGLITGNAIIDPNLDRKRREIITTKDRDEVMGTDLGVNNEYLDIHPMDLLITPSSELPSTGFEGLVENRPPVMPAMNGQFIAHREGLTEEKWQMRWRVIGPSAVAFTFGLDKDYPGNSMTYYLRGSYTVYGRSTDTVTYGDFVRARVPAFERTTREREQELLGTVASNPNHPKDRLEPILSRVNYEDYARLLHHAASESFRASNPNMRDLSKILDPNAFENEDQSSRLALAMRLNCMLAAFVAICTLEDYGMLKIQTPFTSASMADFVRQFQRWDQIEKRGANELTTKLVEVNEDGHATVKDATQEGDRKRYFARMFLASKLGLYNDYNTRGLIKPAENVVEAIFARYAHPFLVTQDLQEASRIEYLLPASMANATLPGANGINTQYNIADFRGQLGYAQATATYSFAMAHARAKQIFDSSILFMSISRKGPGEPWDVLQ